MYEKWLTNPTRARLDQAIYDALASANKRAQARLVTANEVDAEAVLRHPYGIIIVDGGGVAKSYYYAASTTVLTLAWCPKGRKKIVRVAADRYPAKQSAYGLSTHDRRAVYRRPTREQAHEVWSVVFPERASRLRELRAHRLEHRLARLGEPEKNDRMAIPLWSAHVSAYVPGQGLLLSDSPLRPKIVQLVVRDPSTGYRRHITVPPRFANPATKTFQRLQAEGGGARRFRAALAWTHEHSAEEYLWAAAA